MTLFEFKVSNLVLSWKIKHFIVEKLVKKLDILKIV